jgi:hypothetical protein
VNYKERDGLAKVHAVWIVAWALPYWIFFEKLLGDRVRAFLGRIAATKVFGDH